VVVQVKRKTKKERLSEYITRIESGDELTGRELKSYQELIAKNVDETGGELISCEEISRIYGVSRQMVSYNVTRGYLTQMPNGRYRKDDVEKWLADRGRGKSRRAPSVSSDEIKKADLRYRKARADREEVLVKQLKGMLLSKADVEKAFTDRAYELRGQMLMMSRRIAHEIAAQCMVDMKQVAEITDNEVRRWMTDYSRTIEIDS